MRNLKLMLVLLLLPVFLTGCTTFTLTNLTASSQPRNEDGLYPVELEITSNQHALRWDSIKPLVVVGFDVYEMQHTPLMTNRWETLVPLAGTESVLHYRFKVNYNFNDFGGRSEGSRMSTEYTLTVRD